jgi:hypothetical protein
LVFVLVELFFKMTVICHCGALRQPEVGQPLADNLMGNRKGCPYIYRIGVLLIAVSFFYFVWLL